MSDKGAYAVHVVSITSQRQCFVALCLISCVGNDSGSHSICVCFPFSHRLATWANRTDSPQVPYIERPRNILRAVTFGPLLHVHTCHTVLPRRNAEQSIHRACRTNLCPSPFHAL
jgi:hypothetical protein